MGSTLVSVTARIERKIIDSAFEFFLENIFRTFSSSLPLQLNEYIFDESFLVFLGVQNNVQARFDASSKLEHFLGINKTLFTS